MSNIRQTREIYPGEHKQLVDLIYAVAERQDQKPPPTPVPARKRA